MRYIIIGGKPLNGEVQVSGSKNAALPILAATLLTNQQVTLNNVPDIRDVRMMLEILAHLGADYSFSGNTIIIQTKKIRTTEVPYSMSKQLRASLLVVGPLLARAGMATIGYPGGCVLGKRPIDTHLDAFSDLGVKVEERNDMIQLKGKKMAAGKIVLKELSVTGTENVLMVASRLEKTTELRLAAIEPHVQDLCHFLVSIGVKMKGIGTHSLNITGSEDLHGADYTITSDYLEVGSLAIAAAATNGDVRIRGCRRHDLDALWQKLREAGVHVDFEDDLVRIVGTDTLKPIAKLDTGIFPKFPTDLQAPFMVLMSKANGVSKVFETLFEGRLSYLFELEQMGARVEILNPHQAIVVGPTALTGTTVASCDIRAGTAMIIAGLMAEGTTEVTNIKYIDRGYERFDEKLRALGADILRVQSEADLEQRTISRRASEAARNPVLK
jgi:UDP-N-acetylglucosamine 1-carboxyvinyltransferase